MIVVIGGCPLDVVFDRLRGRAISVTPRSREYFGDFGAAAVGLSTGVALDIIGSDGGRRFAPFAVRAISHGCQPIHSWIAQPRHQDRSLCSLLLGSRRIDLFRGTILWRHTCPAGSSVTLAFVGHAGASRPPCTDPFLQSDRRGQTSLGGFNQVGFWSRAVMPGRRDQVVF
jgi:hypothetical protein